MAETHTYQDTQITGHRPIDSTPGSVAPVVLSKDDKVVVHPDYTMEQDFVDEYVVGVAIRHTRDTLLEVITTPNILLRVASLISVMNHAQQFVDCLREYEGGELVGIITNIMEMYLNLMYTVRARPEIQKLPPDFDSIVRNFESVLQGYGHEESANLVVSLCIDACIKSVYSHKLHKDIYVQDTVGFRLSREYICRITEPGIDGIHITPYHGNEAYVRLVDDLAEHDIKWQSEQMTTLSLSDILFGKVVLDWKPLSMQDLTEYTPGLKLSQETFDVYRRLLTPELRRAFLMLGIDMSSLYAREQVELVQYLSTETAASRVLFEQYLHEYGTNGLRLFLVLHSGRIQGRTILEMAQHPSDVTRETVRVFSEMIDTLYSIETVLHREFSDPSGITNGNTFVDALRTRLLARAENYALTTIQQKVEDPNRLVQLQSIKTENEVMLAVAYTCVKEHLPVSLEEFNSAGLERFRSSELLNHNDDVASMRTILDDNYRNSSYRNLAVGGFENGLQVADTDWWLLRCRGQVVAFVRFDELSDEPNTVYGGSFNIAPTFAHSGLAPLMLRETVDRIAATKRVIIDFDASQLYGAGYVEHGFVVTGFEPDKQGLVRGCYDRSLIEKLESKHASREDILVGKLSEKCDRYTCKSRIEADDIIKHNARPDYVLTRFFMEAGLWCVVFESVIVDSMSSRITHDVAS